MNEEFFGKEPEAKPKEAESKYPDPFKPEPEIIYGLEMIGGVAQDGSRYKQPRILHKDKVSKEGVPYTSYWVTVKATPIIVNDDGKPETPYERKEYTWFIPSQCIAKVQEYFEANMYQLCFQKLARLNPETGERHNAYLVGKQVKDFVIFPATNERIHKIFGSKDAIKEKPEAQTEDKEIPFDKYEGDDEVAFKEDVKKEKTHFEKMDEKAPTVKKIATEKLLEKKEEIKLSKSMEKYLKDNLDVLKDNNVTLCEIRNYLNELVALGIRLSNRLDKKEEKKGE